MTDRQTDNEHETVILRFRLDAASSVNKIVHAQWAVLRVLSGKYLLSVWQKEIIIFREVDSSRWTVCNISITLQDSVTLCTLGMGTAFGESILNDSPRHSTVVTREYCELLRVEQKDFKILWEVDDLTQFYMSTCETGSRVNWATSRHDPTPLGCDPADTLQATCRQQKPTTDLIIFCNQTRMRLRMQENRFRLILAPGLICWTWW